MAFGGPPWMIFGKRVMACHGVPALVTLLCAAVFGVSVFEAVSHSIKPVTLTAIWLAPNHFTVAQIKEHALAMERDPKNTPPLAMLNKTGEWKRRCTVTAHQFFVDKRGTTKIQGGLHSVKAPRKLGPITADPRPAEISPVLTPGEWHFRIENYGDCLPGDQFFPIDGMTAEAPFTIDP